MMKERASGILMHISSLPGPYGIGDFGEAAYDFVDFLKATETRYWQILPLGITGFGDSPYQSFSAFAGNPYFIDLSELIEAGYLSEAQVAAVDLGQNEEEVDYAKLYEGKMPLLRQAYEAASQEIKGELERFQAEEDWLEDFCLFMALKDKHHGKSWQMWDEEYKNRDAKALAAFKKDHAEEMGFWAFTQYYFFKQWQKLKAYANAANIKIVGDIPIYVAEDGADIWADPAMFRVDKELAPEVVAGCPPDAFTAAGQLWGNPIYDWAYLKKTGYAWWIKRIKESFRLYDTVRIDHFRGFEAYWEIPSSAKTAKGGRWIKGPGFELFEKVKEELGELDIMAENLGFITQEVDDLIEATGFPGMKVLVFAFDSREDSDYLPHNYDRNSVVYTGNHDTQTVMGFMAEAPEDEAAYAVDYLKLDEDEGYAHGFIRGAWASPAYLAIAPVQDLLQLGDEARFNVPSTLGTNWLWRMKAGALTKELKKKLTFYNHTYRR